MQPLCRGLIISTVVLILCLGWNPVLAADEWTRDVHIQVMLGATRYSDLDFEYQSATDPSVEAASEITVMPTLGICALKPLLKGPAALGLEGGALFGWRRDDVTAVGRNGTLRVHVDNKLWLLDFFFGPYASADIGKGARIYAGAGGLLMAGQYDKNADEQVSESEDENIRQDDTSMVSGTGVYARTGIEFRFEDGSMMGLCVRGFTSRLDFEDLQGDADVKGLQFMITFSPKP